VSLMLLALVFTGCTDEISETKKKASFSAGVLKKSVQSEVSIATPKATPAPVMPGRQSETRNG